VNALLRGFRLTVVLMGEQSSSEDIDGTCCLDPPVLGEHSPSKNMDRADRLDPAGLEKKFSSEDIDMVVVVVGCQVAIVNLRL
jgi:hypothetical protein